MSLLVPLNNHEICFSLVISTNVDGQFWLTLPQGEYAVEIQAPDYVPKTKVIHYSSYVFRCENGIGSLLLGGISIRWWGKSDSHTAIT